jgi:hypothetical protein
MAYVGTIALLDSDGETLKSIRLGSTANEGPRELMERLGSEVHHLLAIRPDLALTVVQDGAPELWRLVEAWLARDQLQPVARHIDRFHVNERLAQTCEAITYRVGDAQALYERWTKQLDSSDDAIDRICSHLDDLCSYMLFGRSDDDQMPAYWREWARAKIDGEAATIAWGNLEYLSRNRDRIRYASSRRRGLAIGSGVTEGACKSMVTMRFKRSGQRWYESGLSPCLQLRALHLNDRLRPCFDAMMAARSASFRPS